jgi:flap endonuclease-1
MGVDGLYKFINKNFPDVYNTVGINEIKGKSCIIDGMQHIYSQLIYMRSREKEVLTSDGKNISHIHGLINSLTYYLKNDIIPIFVFDGKTPDIKKKKIEERKKNLKDNLSKLKELQEQKDNLCEYINLLSGDNIIELDEQIEKNDNEFIYGTPPLDTINLEEEMIKINNIQEEYKKIYKKSIVMKDYFIKDWIQILQLLGLPVIKAEGEADPLCAYMLKNNSNIYGIISDDSDMLVFGSPILMRKSINQQFTIIELEKLLTSIEILLSNECGKYVCFNIDNLVDFSILLGTDYGTFKLNKTYFDSLEILKDYISNDMDYKKLISEHQYEKFQIIKKYYTECNYEKECGELLNKPIWNKPNFLDLKKRLLELDVDEDYIDKNNNFLDICFNKIQKKYIFSKNDFGYKKTRSNSFDTNSHYYNKYNNSNYFGIYDYNKNIFKNKFKNNNQDIKGLFKRLNKNPTFYSDKCCVVDKNKEIIVENNFNSLLDDNKSIIENNFNSLLDDNKSIIENNFNSLLDDNKSIIENNELDIIENRESINSNKSDIYDIFHFDN